MLPLLSTGGSSLAAGRLGGVMGGRLGGWGRNGEGWVEPRGREEVFWFAGGVFGAA